MSVSTVGSSFSVTRPESMTRQSAAMQLKELAAAVPTASGGLGNMEPASAGGAPAAGPLTAPNPAKRFEPASGSALLAVQEDAATRREARGEAVSEAKPRD